MLGEAEMQAMSWKMKGNSRNELEVGIPKLIRRRNMMQKYSFVTMQGMKSLTQKLKGRGKLSLLISWLLSPRVSTLVESRW